MENSVLSLALTGVVPPVCDAEAGERRRSNPTVSQVNSSTGDGSSTDSQYEEVALDQTDVAEAFVEARELRPGDDDLPGRGRGRYPQD